MQEEKKEDICNSCREASFNIERAGDRMASDWSSMTVIKAQFPCPMTEKAMGHNLTGAGIALVQISERGSVIGLASPAGCTLLSCIGTFSCQNGCN